MLGNAKVEAISLIQTSASFEDGYDERVKALIIEHTGAPAYTSAEAIGAAARALGTAKLRSCLLFRAGDRPG